jgi:hypothetical protein
MESFNLNFDNHTHDGDNSLQIDPRNLLGFPIASSAPTDAAPEGTIRLYSSGGTYKLYARINKGWRAVSLT